MEPQSESDDGSTPAKPILQKLALTVARCFYQPAELLIIEMIINEGFVTEERLLSHLKFDVRLVQYSLDVLKSDRIVHFKTVRVEGDEGGRGSRRVDKYYIKYGQLVNVVKYKLEQLRKLVENLERDSVVNKTYVCSVCRTPWSDLDAGELFDAETLKYRCKLCNGDVKGNVSSVPENSRMLVAKFNEQVGPIYDIIRSVEDSLN